MKRPNYSPEGTCVREDKVIISLYENGFMKTADGAEPNVDEEQRMGATIRDVAREAGVSPATVSRVFNRRDLVNAETREHVMSVAQRLQYVPNASARSLSIRHSRVLGLILPLPYSEFFAELVHGTDEAAFDAGYNLRIATSHNDVDATLAGIHMMRGHVDAFLIVSPNIELHLLNDAIPPETPAVFLHSPGPRPEHFSVGIDNQQGAYEAVRHLLDLGHRRIAVIKGPEVNLEVQARIAGYVQALAEYGVAPDPDLLFEGAFTHESGVAATKAVLELIPRPSAIFALNDHMAIAAIRTLIAAGLSVPDDVAVMGFDNIPSGRFMPTPLSTVNVPGREMGRQAVRLVLGAIEKPGAQKPRVKTLTTTLVPRASTLGSRFAGEPDEIQSDDLRSGSLHVHA